jgi:hypothetical protein
MRHGVGISEYGGSTRCENCESKRSGSVYPIVHVSAWRRDNYGQLTFWNEHPIEDVIFGRFVRYAWTLSERG